MDLEKPKYNANNNTNSYVITPQLSGNNYDKQNHVISTTTREVWETNDHTQDKVEYTFTYDNIDYYVRKKWYYTGTYMTVNATIYVESLRGQYFDENNNGTWYLGSESNQTTASMKYKNNCMFVFQITPYNYNINNEVKLKLCITYRDILPTQQINQSNIKLKTRFIVSTENDLAQYLDMISFTSIQDYQDTIESPQNGYNYISYDQEQQINQSILEDYIVNQTFTITPNTTNYIIMFAKPYFNYLDTGSSNLLEVNDWYRQPGLPNYGWARYQDDYTWINNRTWNNATYNTIEISGEYGIPATNQEVIDIPGMMFDILTMPFTFLSIAFNLTLFPGTPYQVNISNLFLAIFGIIVFVAIIKILLNVKNI